MKPNEIAAANNAAWCAAVWRAHGLAVERTHGMLVCRSETPRFYPNVVTVDPGQSAGRQFDLIASLSRDASFEFSVKDSFNALALGDAGFEALIRASWVWCDPQTTGEAAGSLVWKRIGAGDLANWEAAWRGVGASTERIFPDRLLDDDKAFALAGVDARARIVGGLMAYEAFGVIGITNAFGPELPSHAQIAGLTSHAPFVAYASGTALANIQRRGFCAVGDLTVWVKPYVGTPPPRSS